MSIYKKSSVRIAYSSIAAATVVAGLLIASPANAALNDCPSTYTCTWGDSDFKTEGTDSALIKFQMYIPNYGTKNYEGKSLNGANSASSIYNRGVSETSYMYSGTNKNGFLFSIPKGNSNSNLWWVAGANDNIESGYYYSFN